MNTQTISPASTQQAIHPNKVLWEKGDFTKLAATMRDSGANLIHQLGIKPGMEVLDLGCGDGTTAIPAAQLGANVLGVDIAANLVEAGNKRVKEEGLKNCTFREGDAADLKGIENDRFDVLVTVFGAMFASRPLDVAKEMVRVTKPGGKIVMGNWIPNDPTLVAQILKISSAYTPAPPAGFVSPMLWGIENEVIERFAQAGIPKERISFQKDTFTFRAPFSSAQFLDTFKTYYGPMMNAFEAAKQNGKELELENELKALFKRCNESKDENATLIPATLLRVTAIK
ncbi:class I SAM-dependent methyltransferase [Terrimonas sp. NA20]|uniref:Class I SAM-dependent methyltransferase n=1 Tax=Terrimonas ginsenosidimutans TaxID=2908004 RepID=A0ABS9KP49_9BACT|nr:class I SAM-dependent methyltransferase [Terrimonas ginsenosidimutans]MCG2614086.1 class I SAM-dependent methyltransferase [Terrimonas ginsenosidimutans]